uniref:C-type lectin domain-containing protein n=1 Tax=Acrobeloides nanus TaxID=290746 RepID=A0A914CR28_9BILA
MSIERALATLYLNKYEKMGCSFGISLTLSMWFVAISSNVYVFGSNFVGSMSSTLGEATFICVSVGKTPEYQVMHYIMFFIDGTSTVADLLLLHINKKQEGSYTIQVTSLKKNKTMPLEYNLSTRYQIWYNNNMTEGEPFTVCSGQESPNCSDSVASNLWTWNDHPCFGATFTIQSTCKAFTQPPTA